MPKTNATIQWKTYPMDGACAERMEARGLKAHLDHAVNLATQKTLCGVKIDSLCMDDSLATDSRPDCPKCCAKIDQMARKEASKAR